METPDTPASPVGSGPRLELTGRREAAGEAWAASERIAERGAEALGTPAPKPFGLRSANHALLRRSEVHNRALLASLLDPTIVIDAVGTIQAASDSVERVFRYRPDELVGQSVRVLVPEPHRSGHDGHLDRFWHIGQANHLGQTRELEVLRKDGTSVTCDLSVSRVDLPGNPVELYIGSFHDVTERKRVEQRIGESERRFHAIFDEAFQSVWLLDPDGTVLEANLTARQAGGLTREDAVGRPFWDAWWWSHSELERARIRVAVAHAAAGEFARFEVSQRGRDDTVLDLDLSLKPVRDERGRVVLLISEGRDVTELRIAQRSETAMLRALALIGESAAVLVHEIKDPITAVNIALRAVSEQLGEDHRAVLEDLVARMRRLEQLMRGTLSFARPLELQRTRVEADELFADAIADLRAFAASNGSSVRAEPARGIHFLADPQLLGEVLANLVTNAIEAKGEAASVVLSAVPRGKQQLDLCVEDDGPGIPPEQREAIFKPFVTTKPRGTGLGLAICRKIVEEHGGTIRVEGTPRGGARFVVRLEAGS